MLPVSESLDIERRHIAALTWDAMFRSRRAAILADGGGGVFDSVAVWRPAEVGCSVPLLTVSNNKSVQKVRDLFCFQKEQFVVVYRKKMNDLVGTRLI